MNKLNIIAALIGIIAVTPTAQLVAAPKPTATVVSTGDGDTLRIRQDNRLITVRLSCIDAPETAQRPWGQQSAQRLRELLPAGQVVTVRQLATDRYRRTVAEIFVGRRLINLQLVREGKAVVYRQYLKDCNATQYLRAERVARRRRLGFWNQDSPVMPWDFRRERR